LLRSDIDLNEDESENSEDESEEEEDDVMETQYQNENDDSEESKTSSMDDAADLQSSNEEDEPPEALQALESYINDLEIKTPSFKRKASEMGEEAPEPPRQKRRILKEKTEAGMEGEFVPSTRQAGKIFPNNSWIYI
jgi:U3 small nucleolar RNA-associated protein 14